ncbi:MAG: KH domain-containing protein [Patescibacteria group bacterium]
MKEFVEYILKSIVNNPDAVVVEEAVDGTIVDIKITVAKEDMGLVIGKEGRTIKSIRSIAKAKAILDEVKVNVQLEDPYAENKEEETTAPAEEAETPAEE